jgi:hypothetical protein
MDALALSIKRESEAPAEPGAPGPVVRRSRVQLGLRAGGCERLGRVPAHASRRCQAQPLPHTRACSAPALTVLWACDGPPRIHARPPGRSNIAAPPCPAMPSRHLRCPTRPHAIAKRDG